MRRTKTGRGRPAAPCGIKASTPRRTAHSPRRHSTGWSDRPPRPRRTPTPTHSATNYPCSRRQFVHVAFRHHERYVRVVPADRLDGRDVTTGPADPLDAFRVDLVTESFEGSVRVPEGLLTLLRGSLAGNTDRNRDT